MKKEVKMLKYLDSALILYDAGYVNDKDTLRNIMSIVWNTKNRAEMDEMTVFDDNERLLW